MWSACRAAPPVSESQGPGRAQTGQAGPPRWPGWLGRTGRRTKLGAQQVLVERVGAGWGQAGLSMLQSLGGGMLAWSPPLPNRGGSPVGGGSWEAKISHGGWRGVGSIKGER